MGLNAMSFGQNIFTVLDFVISPACWTVEPPSSCNGSGSNGRSMRRAWGELAESSWQGSNKVEPSSITVCEQTVTVVEDFVYFCDLRNLSTQSSADILQRSSRIHAAV